MGFLSSIGGLIGGIVSEYAADKRAQINRQAQIAENQKNREWEEHMYNTYESPSAQQQQMLEAGLNPMGAVSPQSVGSASTSSLPTNSGAANAFGSAVQQAIPQFYEAALAKKQLRLADLEAEQQTLENWKQAFENGNAQELYEIQYQEIESRTTLNREQAKLKKKELETLELTFNKAKEAYEAGINEFKDAHDESVARIDKIRQDISASLNSMINDNIRLDLDLSKFDLDKRLQDITIETAEQTFNDLARSSNIRSLVDQYFHIDYDTLPPYLQSMASALVYVKANFYKYDYGTVGKYKQAQANLKQLEDEFATYYTTYLSNSNDKLSLEAGNTMTTQQWWSLFIQLAK